MSMKQCVKEISMKHFRPSSSWIRLFWSLNKPNVKIVFIKSAQSSCLYASAWVEKHKILYFTSVKNIEIRWKLSDKEIAEEELQNIFTFSFYWVDIKFIVTTCTKFWNIWLIFQCKKIFHSSTYVYTVLS